MRPPRASTTLHRLYLRSAASTIFGCAIVSFSPQATAFERCADLDSGAELRLKKRGIQITNAGGIGMVLATRISLSTKQAAFFPYSAKVGQDRFIVVPIKFLTAACQIVLSDQIPGSPAIEEARERLSLEAATCLERGETPNACLTSLGSKLSEKLAASFASLTREKQTLLFESFIDVIDFILAHELAHHSLGHFEQTESGTVAATHRERTADLAALTMQGQAFKFSESAIHLFGPLAVVEAKRRTKNVSSHESAVCRTLSAASFAIALGNDHITASEEAVAKKLKEIAALKPADVECGYGELVSLIETRRELIAHYKRYIPDMPKLKPSAFNVAVARKAFADQLGQLRSAKFVHVIAGAGLREIAKNWLSYGRRLDDLASVLDTVLVDQKSTARMRNGDYADLLQYRARTIENIASGKPSAQQAHQMRELLLKSTAHAPYDPNAWAWLAMTALKLADCKNALVYAEQSMKTADPQLNDSKTLLTVSGFVRNMRSLAADQSKCDAQSKSAK